MINNLENKRFLINQIDNFLNEIPIGKINKEKLELVCVNDIMRFYISLLQDCILEKN